MENTPGSNNTLASLSKGLLIALAAALLISIYFLFTLPSDLKFQGNIPSLEFATPVFAKLYIILAITAGLAIVAIYSEMRRVKVAIVYKEKTKEQIAEEKLQSETGSIDAIDSKSITGNNRIEILSNTLSAMASKFEGVAGAAYECKAENGNHFAELVKGFALPLSENDTVRYQFGDGMVGQVAKSGKSIYIDDIPEGYFQIMSGLGKASPKFILVIPVKKNNEVVGVIELATFKNISNQGKQVAEKLAMEIGERLS